MRILTSCIVIIALCLTGTVASASQYPQVGETLPAFDMPPLALEEDAVTLGLDSNRKFTLADVPTPYILIEIIGVYCNVCHEELPTLTRLYKRLKKAKLDKRVTMLGIAAGGTPTEVKYIRQKDYLFPMVHDTEFEIYDKFGDTKTPFTMLVDKTGKVLYAHQGPIPDVRELISEIQALVK